MIKEPITKALSDQLNAELYSAYLYLSMAADADRLGYKGVANWLQIQAKEELAHGKHIYRHILDRQATPTFGNITAPETSFNSIKAIFEKVLAHEKHVTELINNIASLAMQGNDHASYNFIMWYVNEQVEEEANTSEILSRIHMIGDNPDLLYSLNAELAARVFVDPFPAE
jgi:ferritin